MTDLRLNADPLDQLAEKLLLQEKQELSDGFLYGLQLVIWMLENHPQVVPLPAAKFADELELYAAQMLGWEPEHALRMLVSNPDEPLAVAANAEAAALRDEDAQTVAASLVENLWSNLSERMPSLRLDW